MYWPPSCLFFQSSRLSCQNLTTLLVISHYFHRAMLPLILVDFVYSLCQYKLLYTCFYACIGLVSIVVDIEWIFSKVDETCLNFINASAISIVVSEVAARAGIGTAYITIKSCVIKVVPLHSKRKINRSKFKDLLLRLFILIPDLDSEEKTWKVYY